MCHCGLIASMQVIQTAWSIHSYSAKEHHVHVFFFRNIFNTGFSYSCIDLDFVSKASKASDCVSSISETSLLMNCKKFTCGCVSLENRCYLSFGKKPNSFLCAEQWRHEPQSDINSTLAWKACTSSRCSCIQWAFCMSHAGRRCEVSLWWLVWGLIAVLYTYVVVDAGTSIHEGRNSDLQSESNKIPKHIYLPGRKDVVHLF